ncbi:MAG TPA: hypothetical protein VF813_00460, partial [Anaerolineaceae bacterium]
MKIANIFKQVIPRGKKPSGTFKGEFNHSRDSAQLDTIFWVTIIVVSLFRLWLTSSLPLLVNGNAGHDDLLFIKLASNILHGSWLGSYNQFTLIKGPFYPIFIDLSFLSGFPLL